MEAVLRSNGFSQEEIDRRLHPETPRPSNRQPPTAVTNNVSGSDRRIQRNRSILFDDSDEEEISTADSPAVTPDSPSTHGEIGPELVFPKCINELGTNEDDDAVDLLKTLPEVVPKPAIPIFHVSMDIDSIYGTFTELDALVDALGPKTEYGISTNTSHLSSTTSSRFSMNVSALDDPPLLCGSIPSSVPLEWFPNIRIATCVLKEFGVTLHIHLFDTGVRNLRKSGKFRHKEVAVVNAAINIAFAMAVRFSEDRTSDKRFSAMKRVRTPVGSADWKPFFKTSYTNHLTPDMMKSFSTFFKLALQNIANNSDAYQFWTPLRTGMVFQDESDNHISRESMVEYAKSLEKNCLFVFSAAGTKQVFDKDRYRTKLEQTDEQKQVCRDIFDNNKECFLMEKFGYDDPSEIRPGDSIDITEIHNLPSFGVYFPNYTRDFMAEMGKKIDELSGKLYHDFRKAIGRDTPGSEAQDGHRNGHLVNIDMGAEFYTEGVHTLLLHTSNSSNALSRALDAR